MKPSFMPDSNQSDDLGNAPFVWLLPAGEALTLRADAAQRALWVHEGRVWLTRRCEAGTPDDIWLQPGQSHTLPAGSEWVVEAAPRARVTLLQAAPARIRPRRSASWAAAWQAATQLGRAFS